MPKTRSVGRWGMKKWPNFADAHGPLHSKTVPRGSLFDNSRFAESIPTQMGSEGMWEGEGGHWAPVGGPTIREPPCPAGWSIQCRRGPDLAVRFPGRAGVRDGGVPVGREGRAAAGRGEGAGSAEGGGGWPVGGRG